jgi:hypothetical protein
MDKQGRFFSQHFSSSLPNLSISPIHIPHIHIPHQSSVETYPYRHKQNSSIYDYPVYHSDIKVKK